MKAILKVRRNSLYSNKNGKTFPVHSINWLPGGGNGRVSLIGVSEEFPQAQVDFIFDEVEILDIKKQVRENWDNLQVIRCLLRYCQYKHIEL